MIDHRRPPYKSADPQGSRHRSQTTTATTTGVRRKSSISHLLSRYRNEPSRQPPPSQPDEEFESPIIVARPPRSRLRKLSVGSVSSYSSDYSDSEDYSSETHNDSVLSASTVSDIKRRTNAPSEGAVDRRRVAVVQMDTLKDAMSASGTSSSTSSIRSRRGLMNQLAGLALVAPPDAEARSYTQLTPPPTAPLHQRNYDTTGHQRSASEAVDGANASVMRRRDMDDDKDITNSATFDSINNNGLRSNGEPSSSRAVVGHRRLLPPTVKFALDSTSSSPSPPMTTPKIGASKEIHIPVAAPIVVDLASSKAMQQQPSVKLVSTPKSHISSITLQPDGSSTIDRTPFLGYQPGIHATAGPLPPPPRAAFPIPMQTPPPPRPPRLHSPAPPRVKSDLEAVKQALQLPPSVAAKLAAKTSQMAEVKPLNLTPRRDTPKNTQEDDKDDDEVVSPALPRTHRREGAFESPSSKPTLDDTNLEAEGTVTSLRARPLDGEDDVPSVTIIEEEAKPGTEELDQEESKELEDSFDEAEVYRRSHHSHSLLRSPSPASGSGSSEHGHGNQQGTMLSDDGLVQRSLSPSSVSSSPKRYQTQFQHQLSQSPKRSASVSSSTAPSPPPKSFRNNLATNLKRFSSLPRTPSRASRRSSAQYSHTSSRTPSPSVQVRGPRRKIIDFNPAAMFCHEVYQQRTPAERCQIYIEKINELYIHDCGLSGWLLEMKHRGTAPQPRGPSSQPFQPQPRQTSRSSMISEMTFPRRPDAYVATDLSAQSSTYHDISPATVAVNLPYPSLATQQRQQSIRSTTSNTSAGSGMTPPPSVRSLAPSNGSSKTGFFASLGRKASISTGARRERAGTMLGHATSSATNRTVLSKQPPSTKDISRPIFMSTTNSAHGHGGPAQGPSGPRAPPPHRAQRSKTLMTPVTPTYHIEREEVLGRRPSLFDLTSPTQETRVDPAFAEQVDKLQSVLPHADRAVLAGYLRRAGQDVLALGQYIDDEKNGTLKYF